MSLEEYRRGVSEAKHGDILKAALNRFLADGYSRAAMAEVARDADVSTATLYKHFGSKEELFAAVVTEAAEAVHEDFGAIPADATAQQFFFKILLDGLAAQTQNRVNDILRIVIAEAGIAPDLARLVYKVVVEGRYRRVQGVLDEMVKRGLLKPHDTWLGARMAMGMMKELFVWPSLFDADYRPPPEALAQAQAAIDTYLARYGA